jgi:hypothetical protein
MSELMYMINLLWNKSRVVFRITGKTGIPNELVTIIGTVVIPKSEQ